MNIVVKTVVKKLCVEAKGLEPSKSYSANVVRLPILLRPQISESETYSFYGFSYLATMPIKVKYKIKIVVKSFNSPVLLFFRF